LAPHVSLIVYGAAPCRALHACLQSLAALDWPLERCELIVPGSCDIPAAPWSVYRVHARTGARAGFCNLAAARATGEWLAFVDASTTVQPCWLTDSIAAGERHDAAAVGAPIYDASGRELRCGSLDVFRSGHARVVTQHTSSPVLAAPLEGLVVRRDWFAAAGALDPMLDARYDDVDLGWRLTLRGGIVVARSAAGVCTDRVVVRPPHPTPAERRLLERNALAILFKNADNRTLGPRLAAAVAAALERALSDLPGRGDRLTSPPGGIAVSVDAIATLSGLDEFTRTIPLLKKAREDVQRERRVDDSVLDALFAGDADDAAAATAETILAACGEPRPVEAPSVRQHVEERSERPPGPAATSNGNGNAPEVSIIVLTATGPRHLPAFLDSLAAADFPHDRLEVLVVDNGSREDPTACIREHYPHASVLRLPRNLGFCGGNNAAARLARGRWLLFLNDDTRIDPAAIEALLDTAARRAATAVGALVLDWDGERVDFGAGAVNFEGKGFQLGVGATDIARWRTERPLFFACGAAMLIDREVFLASGGFPDSYFAYYEDVAVGWRLRALGHEIWLSPEAIVHHRHHGTSGQWSATRVRLCEANSLQTLFSLVEDRHLGRVLSAALLLSVARILLDAGLANRPVEGDTAISAHLLWMHARHALVGRGARRERGAIGSLRRVGVRGLAGAARDVFRVAFGSSGIATDTSPRIERLLANASAEDTWRVDQSTAAALLALADWLELLPLQQATRDHCQRARVRDDASVLHAFRSHWIDPVPAPDQPIYDQRQYWLVSVLDIAGIPGDSSDVPQAHPSHRADRQD
jgi:GT2 family glycosyltransferase